MELWQMGVVGGIHLADGVEVKVVTGIDQSRGEQDAADAARAAETGVAPPGRRH